MNIHEHQAKQLLKKYGAIVPNGVFAFTVKDLLEKGSAFYAPAAAGVEMASAYMNNEKKLLPCAAYLSGEYGVCLLYTSPSPRDRTRSRMPSSA